MSIVQFSIPRRGAKAAFFDRKRVSSVINRRAFQVNRRFGGFVRRTAMNSLRQRKKAAPPGQPPHSHTKVLKRNIFFFADPNDNNVIIGPAKTNQTFFNKDGKPVKGTVPEVLEYGGSIRVFESKPRWANVWRRVDLRSRRRIKGQQTRLRRVDIEARPYMRPAFEKGKARLDSFWREARNRKA
jgi:hypothetical protein